jgi:hypothetical protein
MFIQRVLTAAFVMLPFASQAQNDAVFNYGFDPHMGYREIRLPDRNDGVACSGANNPTAQIRRIHPVQTHVLGHRMCSFT